jgi:hypothetical protein
MRPRYPPVAAPGALRVATGSGPRYTARPELANILDTFASSYYDKPYKWPGLKRAGAPRKFAGDLFDQGHIMGGGCAVVGRIACGAVCRPTITHLLNWVTHDQRLL